MIAGNLEIKSVNVSMLEKKGGWFLLEDVTWAYDSLSELKFKVELGK